VIAKRAYLTEKGKFTIKEVDLKPKADEVLIKVALCGLCNWELNFWKSNGGMYSEYPALLGHEWSGIVVEVGENVTKLEIGDKVTSYEYGGFGEYNVAKENMCYKVDSNVKYENAMGEPIKCISTVLTGAAPKVGDCGVIVGCGAMGQWCIQCLGNSFLSHLIAIDIDDKKLEIAKKHGATHIINSAKENAVEKIREITNGLMADFVIEGTGVPEVLNGCSDYLKSKGRLVLMSSHERSTKEFNFTPIFGKGISLIGASPDLSADAEDDLRRGTTLINNGIINNDLLISHRFTLNDINVAFSTLENKPKDYIKGVVVCNEDLIM
jgi:threonine dehydrogenase-like Zn-dependent dehydrogenase